MGFPSDCRINTLWGSYERNCCTRREGFPSAREAEGRCLLQPGARRLSQDPPGLGAARRLREAAGHTSAFANSGFSHKVAVRMKGIEFQAAQINVRKPSEGRVVAMCAFHVASSDAWAQTHSGDYWSVRLWLSHLLMLYHGN